MKTEDRDLATGIQVFHIKITKLNSCVSRTPHLEIYCERTSLSLILT
jgi:hypothetical protein